MDILDSDEIDKLLSTFNNEDNEEKEFRDWERYGAGYHYDGDRNIKKISIVTELTKITNQCFSNMENLEEVSICEGITEIGSEAFASCKNLKKVTLPKTLRSIGEGCFTHCSSLKEICIPDYVEEILGNAFSFSGLEEIELPQRLKNIERECFASCTSLKEVKLNIGIEEIPSLCFYNCENLTNISLPFGLLYIGMQAFNGCNNLENLFIPDSVCSIDILAFARCTKLKSVKLSSSLHTIGSSIFQECTSISFLRIPNGVKVIESAAFCSLENLETLILPSSVIRIEDQACINLKKLTTVVMNKELLKEENIYHEDALVDDDKMMLGRGVFTGCDNLHFLNGQILEEDYLAFGGRLISYLRDKENIILSEDRGISVIDQYSFKGLNNVKSITLPSTINHIEANAFRDCENLESLNIREDLYSFGENIVTSCNKINCKSVKKDKCFIYINNVADTFLLKVDFDNLDLDATDENKDIVMPSFTKGFVPYLFSYSKIRSIVINEGVTELPSYLFSCCSNLEKVKLPRTLKKIGKGCFENCESLKLLNIPKNCDISEEDCINFTTCKVKIV